MTDPVIPYIKNQICLNHINLGSVIITILWICITMAIVSSLVAFSIAFLRRKHEMVDGQKQEIFTDRWAWIPLVSTVIWVFAFMTIIFKFMNM